jgi:hypothetical protein
MMRGRLDTPTLAGGLSLLVVGLFLLLDSVGELDLTVGWTASLLLAAAGLTLVVSGVAEERRRRG